MVSLGFQEKSDSALFISNQCPDMAAAERYPFVSSGEDVCGYEWVGTWVSCGGARDELKDVACMSEGGEAWNIGLKVDTAEKEGDLVGSPEHFRRGMRG